MGGLQAALILGGLALALVVAALVAWLKGTLSLVGQTFREAGHQAGEPWTVGLIIEPALSVPTVFAVAAVGLARPDSRWARWFYGDAKTARSRERFDEDPT